MPWWHRRKLRRLCRRFLEPLRLRYGPVTVNSGHRSASHNQRVGGAPRSFHLAIAYRRGAGADVRCERGSPADWYRTLDSMGIGGLGLYGGYVHADTRRRRARW
jgi:uncharacterized protein YcbK (DUF882 family)